MDKGGYKMYIGKWYVCSPKLSKKFKLFPYQLNSITDPKKKFPIYRFLFWNFSKRIL